MFYDAVRVGPHYLTLIIEEDGEVTVKVDGQYTNQNLPPRVGAILIRKGRKLFEQFALANPGVELWCSAYNGDQKGDYRLKVFTWAGFRPDPDCIWKLVYQG